MSRPIGSKLERSQAAAAPFAALGRPAAPKAPKQGKATRDADTFTTTPTTRDSMTFGPQAWPPSSPLPPQGPITPQDVTLEVVSTNATGVQVPHDSIAPIPQDATKIDPRIVTHQPQWSIEGGVKPRPAVDEKGNHNGGLKPSGGANDDPSGKPYDYGTQGQVYAKLHEFGPGGHPDNPDVKSAVMYTMYWPKDTAIGVAGHRHDWEDAVVLLDAKDQALGTAYSGHGTYRQATNRLSEAWSGEQPLVEYDNYEGKHGVFDAVTHSTGSTSKGGDSPPLVDVTLLPPAAQDALESTDWGSANYPMRSDRFEGQLDKAVAAFNKIPEGQSSWIEAISNDDDDDDDNFF